MSTISYPTSSSPHLSLDQISRATQYLVSTRDDLLQAAGIPDDSQWHFKPAPDCWSIAEILEHLVLIEGRVHAIVGGMPDAPAASPDRMDSQVDKLILANVPSRSTKVQAPLPVTPSGRWSPAEARDLFIENRARTVDLLAAAPSLRGHVLPHPLFGPWDGYQWILATAAHTARHTSQITEIKACSGFPEPQAAAVGLH
jgi:hypothetical protein